MVSSVGVCWLCNPMVHGSNPVPCLYLVVGMQNWYLQWFQEVIKVMVTSVPAGS